MPPHLDRCVQQVMDREDSKKKWPDLKVRKQHAFAICRSSTGLTEGARMGFLVDLTEAINFAEGDDEQPRWIHIMPVNTKVIHPKWGELEFTPEKIQKFHDNVEKNVRGVMLDIDYEHKEGVDGGRAAGWINRTEVRENGLWGLVSWTKKAAEEIRNKVWRYFSPEFDWKWLDASGNEHENVMFGGALTNRPFLKNLVPINLHEELDSFELDDNDDFVPVGTVQEEVTNLDLLKKIKKLLGLAEDASDDAVESKVKALTESAGESVVKLRETLSLDKTADDRVIIAEVKKLSDFYKDNDGTKAEARKKFAEDYPDEAKQLEEQRKTLVDQTVDNKLAEWTSGKITLTEKDKEGNEQTIVVNSALPPVVLDEVREVRRTLTGETAEKFDSFIRSLLRAGTVDTSEGGSSTAPPATGEGSKTAAVEFTEKVKAKQAEAEKAGKAIKFTEASKAVRLEEPELYKRYQREQSRPRAVNE